MNKNGRGFFNISFRNKTLMIFICSFFILIFLFSIKCILINISIGKIANTFGVDILNSQLPICTQVNNQDDTYLSNDISIKKELFLLLGINKNNPNNILSKEMSSLSNISYKSKSKTVSPYTLDATAISRGEVASNEANTSDNVSNSSLKLKELGEKPRVYIYNSHICESYAPGPDNTLDQSVNVSSVGDELKKELENNYNIYTIHDKTIHDIYGYIDSYKRSGDTLSKYLKQYGDFDLIIDMHRDSIIDKKVVTMKINGESTANVRFVMTKSNPHFDKNMAIANRLAIISNKLYPGFCREPFFYNKGTDFFNQDKSNNAVLIEVGSVANTTIQAKASAKYLARTIAEYLHEK